MSFETISLLLSWVELGVLLAILLRLGRTFELIAGTQRELRRAIHHLGEQRAAQPQVANAFGDPAVPRHTRLVNDADDTENHMDTGDFGTPIAYG